RRAQRVAHQARGQATFLVARLSARDQPRARSRPGEPGGGRAQRSLPGDGPQAAAVAHERRGDALIDVDRLVAEAPLVAQPAVVDVGVLAREHAQRALVPDGYREVALRRTQRADRARVLDI